MGYDGTDPIVGVEKWDMMGTDASSGCGKRGSERKLHTRSDWGEKMTSDPLYL